MTDRAVFLDRDGVINRDIGYTYKVEDLEFLPGTIEGLKKLQNTNYKLIVVTNQSGIARGYYTERDYFRFKDEMHKRLKEKGVLITAEYFCPHHPEKGIGKYKIDCNCRKPKIGMPEQAARDFNLDLSRCWMIGDSETDIQTGKNAGCRTIQVLTGENKQIMSFADFVAINLVEAANYILSNSNK